MIDGIAEIVCDIFDLIGEYRLWPVIILSVIFIILIFF